METTGSGNLHGMPVSFLMGLNAPLEGFEWMPKERALRPVRLLVS